MSNPNPAPAKAPVIRTDPLAGRPDLAQTILRSLPACCISIGIHAVLLTVFFVLVNTVMAHATDNLQATKRSEMINSAVEPPEKEPDLITTDIGLNSDLPPGYDVERDKEPVDVPGPVDPNAAIGIVGAPVDAPPQNIPPPPGSGKGQGAGLMLDGVDGTGKIGEFTGGYGNIKAVPGGFGGRSGSTRVRRAIEGGGSPASEACVARGLQWLALHQCDDGHWSLKEFNKFYRENLKAPRKTVNEGGQVTNDDEMAATAFGLLPFLAAGKTHKKTGDEKEDTYVNEVTKAIDWICKKQTASGDLGSASPGQHHMYTHGLATIALCEAYGMTNDAKLRRHAQQALNFIETSQNKSGGWRYTPTADDADTSVVGWQLMALKSGQMAGLSVKTETLDNVKKWLDKCENTKALQSEDKAVRMTYGYGYTNPQASPAMTAVGLLCRQYLQTPPRNPGLLQGVAVLRNTPPGSGSGIYYEYYATQVMHHMGGDSWDFWNDGPKKNKDGIRDILIAKQDTGNTAGKPTQLGSWEPDGSSLGAGGRVMQTALSLLTLEVYYRHLPLYRKETATNK